MQIKVVRTDELKQKLSEYLERINDNTEFYSSTDIIDELTDDLSVIKSNSKSYAIVENANFIHYLDTKKEHSI